MTIKPGDTFMTSNPNRRPDVSANTEYTCTSIDEDGCVRFFDDVGDANWLRPEHCFSARSSVEVHEALINLVDALVEEDVSLSGTALKAFSAAERAVGR